MIHKGFNLGLESDPALAMIIRWAIKDAYTNVLDGHREWFHWEDARPVLFVTKREAIAYIKERYSYRRNRHDLRKEPFCWRMPKAVKVEVILKEVVQ